MKSFIIRYTDEEGLTTYHAFNEGFSCSVTEDDMVYTLRFFDPALGDKCVHSVDIYVEPTNPYLHIAIMHEQELFMLETLEKVEDMVLNAIDEHIESGNTIFNLNLLSNEIDAEMDVFAEDYADEHLKDLPEQIQEAVLEGNKNGSHSDTQHNKERETQNKEPTSEEREEPEKES